MNDDLRSQYRQMADRVEGQIDAAAAWQRRDEKVRPSGVLIASVAAITIMVAIGSVLMIRLIEVGPTDTILPSPTTVTGSVLKPSTTVVPTESSLPATGDTPESSTSTTETTTLPPIVIYPPVTHVVAEQATVEMRSEDGTEVYAILPTGTGVYYGREWAYDADGEIRWEVSASEPIEWFGPPLPPDTEVTLSGWVDPVHLRSLLTYLPVRDCDLPGSIGWMESSGGEALDGAIQVASYELIELGGCRRLIVSFSQPVAPEWQSQANTPQIRVLLSSVGKVQPGATSYRWDGGALFAVREIDGSVNLEIELGDAAVNVEESPDGRQLVVDFAPNQTPTGTYAPSTITDSLVLRTPPVSTAGAIELPDPRPYQIYEGESVLVDGFATNDAVTIRIVDEEGEPLMATYTGTDSPGPAQEAVVSTTADERLWGKWRFFVNDLAPGEYSFELSTGSDTIVAPFTVLAAL